jgi:predicted nucleotidyltransferase
MAGEKKTNGSLGLQEYREVLQRLLEMMRRRFGDRVLAVALFGSAAGGRPGRTAI